jgi:hypothetical protein
MFRESIASRHVVKQVVIWRTVFAMRHVADVEAEGKHKADRRGCGFVAFLSFAVSLNLLSLLPYFPLMV